MYIITVLILTSSLVDIAKADVSCLYDESQRQFLYTDDSIVFFLEENVIVDKDEAGWFDLKACFFMLKDIQNQINLEDPDNLENPLKAKVANAIKGIEYNLRRYREDFKQLNGAVLYSVFCNVPFNINNKSKLVPVSTADIKTHPDIPTILKESFSKGVSILKCDQGNHKVLIISAMGSTAATSDYDFNVFVIDPRSIQAIETQLSINTNKKNAVLTEDNLVLLNDKSIYFAFATMMINSFKESCELVDKIYNKFEEILPKETLISQGVNPNPNYAKNVLPKGFKNHTFSVEFDNKNNNKLVCTGMTSCFDSNAYPDTMALNRLILKLPLRILGNKVTKEDLGFDEKDIRNLDLEYLIFSVNSICNYSLFPLQRTENPIVQGHLLGLLSDCNNFFRGQADVGFDNMNELQYMKDELDLYEKIKDDVARKSEKTFPACLRRLTLLDNMDDVDTFDNFNQIYRFSHYIAICTLYLDEGYFTFGALEHYKFTGDKAKTLLDLSFAESFAENFSMLMIHFEDKIEHNTPLSNQGISDMYSKYFLRAFNAMNTLFDNLKAPKTNVAGWYRFNYNDLVTYIHSNVGIRNYIHNDNIKFKNFAEQSFVFTAIASSNKSFNKADEYEQKTLFVFYSCLHNYFSFYDSLKLMEEDLTLANFSAAGYKYSNDDQKKSVMFDKFTVFTNQRTESNACPVFTDATDLLIFTHMVIRFSELYMYDMLKEILKNYLNPQFKYADETNLIKVESADVSKLYNKVGDPDKQLTYDEYLKYLEECRNQNFFIKNETSGYSISSIISEEQRRIGLLAYQKEIDDEAEFNLMLHNSKNSAIDHPIIGNTKTKIYRYSELEPEQRKQVDKKYPGNDKWLINPQYALKNNGVITIITQVENVNDDNSLHVIEEDEEENDYAEKMLII